MAKLATGVAKVPRIGVSLPDNGTSAWAAPSLSKSSWMRAVAFVDALAGAEEVVEAICAFTPAASEQNSEPIRTGLSLDREAPGMVWSKVAPRRLWPAASEKA